MGVRRDNWSEGLIKGRWPKKIRNALALGSKAKGFRSDRGTFETRGKL
jgi:hypothetical protein